VNCKLISLGFSRSSSEDAVNFINFKADKFSYLNITTIGSELVQSDAECGFACLGIASCFSYNLAAFSDINGKLLCELLPSDKFNNSDDFTSTPIYHHFSIPVSHTIVNSDIKLFLKDWFTFVHDSEELIGIKMI